MRVGVPKEIKTHEYRVGLLPGAVRELTLRGHEVWVESGAGAAIGYGDEAYVSAGARVVEGPEALYAAAELIVKVKEPQPQEWGWLGPRHTLFAYLHLAADAELTRALLASGAVCIAFETVTDQRGGLPLLAPMSEVAGRMAVQAAAACLERERGGRGILLGGVPGVAPGRVVVLGGGVAGSNAVQMALGLGAEVVVLDRDLERLRTLAARFGPALRCLYATQEEVERQVLQADVVIGAVLVPGAAAPKLVPEERVRRMKRGAVVVDVSIDQGGCVGTSRPTTHADPTFIAHGVVHYCVTNMPGAVPHTSTYALNNALLPLVLALAERGTVGALAADPHLRAGLNIWRGRITCRPVAESLGLPYLPAEEALAREGAEIGGGQANEGGKGGGR